MNVAPILARCELATPDHDAWQSRTSGDAEALRATTVETGLRAEIEQLQRLNSDLRTLVEGDRVELDQRDAALAVLTRELADLGALAWSWRRLGAVLCGYDVHGEGCDRPATRVRSVMLRSDEAMVWWRCDAHEAGGEGWCDVPHAAAIRALDAATRGAK